MASTSTEDTETYPVTHENKFRLPVGTDVF